MAPDISESTEDSAARKRLQKKGYHREEPWPLGLLTAIMLLLIGAYAFVVVLANP